MSVEQNSPAAPVAAMPGTAYGRFIRERGTMKIVLLAVVLAVAWYAYSAIHVHLLLQKKLPPLQPDPHGLTVVGLRDKDRPGWQHVYEARESNHAWQIRYREDSAGGDEDSSGSGNSGSASAQEDRGYDPGAAHHVNSGAVVPIETVLKTCPVVLLGRDFSGADITQDFDAFYNKPFYRLVLHLTDDGQARYWQWAHAHEKERIAFILGDQAIACPRITQDADVGSVTIDPIWIKSDAQTLADAINKRKR